MKLKKETRLYVKVSNEQKERLKVKAESLGMTLSAYIRYMLGELEGLE